MDRRPPWLKMLLLMVLLSTNAHQPHASQITGSDHGLHCLNDYLFTVSCSLSVTVENNGSYWLNFTEALDPTTYVCRLTRSTDSYFCSFQKPNHSGPFSESDSYRILLCRDQDEQAPDVCQLLDDNYLPVENIRPNAPCCLAVSHNSTRYHFTWSSTYERYGLYTRLAADLHYQLHIHNGGDGVILHQINTHQTHFSMDEATLVEGEEYSATVRSSPGQWFYTGQWSRWSSQLHWRATNHGSPSKDLSRNTFLRELLKVFVPLSAAMLLILLLCCVPVNKWRRSVFIPTPAPYFDTLYRDCRGDFKSWVVTQESPSDLLIVEETLQIDTVTKCVEEDRWYPRARPLTEEHTYNNLDVLVADEDPLGLPYAVSTMAPQGGSAGLPEYRLYCPLKNENPWYRNEYCTLTDPQPPDSDGGF